MPAEPAARRVTIAAVLAVAGAVLAVAVVLLAIKETPSLIATNRADESAFVATARAGDPYCQRYEQVPVEARAVRMLIGTYGRPGPALRLEFRPADRQGRLIAEGRRERGWRQGHVVVPLRRVRDARESATMCVEPSGSDQIALAGQRTGDRRRQVVRLEYLDSKKVSDLSRLDSIADHYGRGKSRWEGPWTLGLTAALVAFALLLAARGMLVEGQR